MNKQRRNRLQKVIDKLEELKEEVSSICEEEQEAYDNIPESLQDGEIGIRCTITSAASKTSRVISTILLTTYKRY